VLLAGDWRPQQSQRPTGTSQRRGRVAVADGLVETEVTEVMTEMTAVEVTEVDVNSGRAAEEDDSRTAGRSDDGERNSGE